MKITKSLKTKLNGKMRREEVWCKIEDEREKVEKEEEPVYDERDDYDRRYREWRDEGGCWK